MTLQQFQDWTAELHRRTVFGCGNHGCRIDDPKGQATNSICRCAPRMFSRELLQIAAQLEKDGSLFEPETQGLT